MRFARTLTLCLPMVLATGLLLPGSIFCQDAPETPVLAPSLFSRLDEVKFVGITRSRDSDRLTLVAMSEEQHTAYERAVAKSKEHRKKFDDAWNAALAKVQDATQRNESPEVVVELQRDLDRRSLIVHNKRVRSTFEQFGSHVHRVVSVGTDYVEILSEPTLDMTELIPFSEIRKVIFRKDLPKFELLHE